MVISHVQYIALSRDGSLINVVLSKCYLWNVRRGAAFCLLLLTALMPLQPLVAQAQQQAGVPACCRRNGTHHCAMLPSMPMTTAISASHRSLNSAPCRWWKLPVISPAVATEISVYRFNWQSASGRENSIPGGSAPLSALHRLKSSRAPPNLFI